jgi:hypothetical protein
MFRICYHVPESHLENTKTAMFDAGAGRNGGYEHCCWQVRGEGQFRPMAGSQPYHGEEGVLARLPEYRVEMICDEAHIEAVVVALKNSHPYEVPSYQVIRLENF